MLKCLPHSPENPDMAERVDWRISCRSITNNPPKTEGEPQHAGLGRRPARPRKDRRQKGEEQNERVNMTDTAGGSRGRGGFKPKHPALRSSGGHGMTAETMRENEIREIVSRELEDRFTGSIQFGPINVEERLDQDGDPYIHIIVVFDGEQSALDPDWTGGLINRIRPELTDLGIVSLPSKSFIKKSEWQTLQARR